MSRVVDEEVGGFDVAVHDPARVGFAKAKTRLVHDVARPLGVETVAEVVELVERLAVEQLHQHEDVAIAVEPGVEDRDHVTFDIFYNVASPRARSIMAFIGAAVIAVALWSSIGPTYDRMRLLRLKSSATLPVKMLPIYSIYFLFLTAVGLRYLWRAVDVARHGADKGLHVLPYENSVREEELK